MGRLRPSDNPAAVALMALSIVAYPVGVAYLPTEPPREPSRYAEVVPLEPASAFPQGLGIGHATAFLPPPKPVESAAAFSYRPSDRRSLGSSTLPAGYHGRASQEQRACRRRRNL